MDDQGTPDHDPTAVGPHSDPDTVTDDRRVNLSVGHARLHATAIKAEQLTGRHESSVDEARHNLGLRALRAAGGFALIGVGIALLPLPGPGWVIIIVGLSLLPFTWARRMIRLIRRKIPGVPEDGRIPASTWVLMGLVVVVATVVSILFGRQIGTWIGDTWTDLWN